MAEFRIPNTITYGEDTVSELSKLTGQRLLLVYDTPLIDKHIEKILLPSGITVRSFYANPQLTDTMRITEGTKAMMEFKPDWILAAGGYTAMNLAKLIRIFYQQPGLSVQDAIQGKASNIALSKTKLIALPLYNTNGSEATCAVHFHDASSMYQCEIHNASLLPNITILDSSMLAFSNGGQLAQCILSTFALTIEASANIPGSSFVHPFALEAISILSKSVLAFSSAPVDTAPLLYAQCIAGIAHTNSAAGLCSILCRACVSFCSASFGSLAAAILPAVINMEQNPDKYLPAANAMGLNDAKALADAVAEYADMLGLPLTLSELGVDKNTFLKKLSKVSHSILPLLPNGIIEGKEPQKHIEQILRMAYSHKEL